MTTAEFREMIQGLLPGHTVRDITPGQPTGRPAGSLKDWMAKRSAALDKAEGILATCERDNKRAMTQAENADFTAAMAEVTALNPHIEAVNKTNAMRLTAGGKYESGDVSHVHRGPSQSRHIPEMSEAQRDFILQPLLDWTAGRISATDTPWQRNNSGLGDVIPTRVLDALRTYVSNDPFRLAGATVYQTDDIAPLIKPVVMPGADATTFSEGSSATESHAPGIDSFTFGATKYSRLVKVSEESLLSVELNLPQEIQDELAASVTSTFTKAITTAMQAAFYANGNVFESNGADPYEAILNLIAAVPTRFESPDNCFMLSRADLKVIRNARATSSGVPFFNPQDGSILGKRAVINDSMTRVAYGNWAAGVFIRKSPYFLQRLEELYSSSGLIGFKATQYLDSHFLAEVTAAEQPLYFVSLDTEGS